MIICTGSAVTAMSAFYQTAPRLKNAFTKDNSTIVLVFYEAVDSLSGATISNYTIDGGISLNSAETISPFNQVELKTNNPLAETTVYTITANNVTDCRGNEIESANKARIGLAVDATAGNCIINEILFNPRSNANDYAEFYNKSDKIFDASELYIANRSNNGAVSSIKQLSTTPFNIFPGDYIVVSEDAENLALNYLVKNADAVLTLLSLPSFPDDKGTVI